MRREHKDRPSETALFQMGAGRRCCSCGVGKCTRMRWTKLATIGEGARRYRLGRATIARPFEAATQSTRDTAIVYTLRYVQGLSGDTLMSRLEVMTVNELSQYRSQSWAFAMQVMAVNQEARLETR
jgi:hypothetical protein